jgi:Uma2 family endonuclease
MTLEVPRRRFTTTEYARIGAAGVFGEDDRVELLDGEIVQMPPIGFGHAACVRRLTDLFTRRLGARAQVSVQNPVELDEHTQPQPDAALLRPRADYYAAGHPTAAAILLLVEVADTSVDYDRQLKVPLYARHGVGEVWLVDLTQPRLVIYGDASPQGYRTVRILQRADVVSPAAFPDQVIPVSDILG